MSTLSTNQIVVEYIIREGDVNRARNAFDNLTDAEKKALLIVQQLNDRLRTTGTEGRRSTDEVSKGLTSISGIAGKLTGLLAGVFAISKIKAFSEEVLKTTIQFDTLRKAINFTSGSMEVGSANFNFLKENSNQLGISLQAAAEGFKTISGAASQAGYSNKQVQEIFLNTSKSVAAFGLSAEQSNGVFQALSQIISKGVVSMEELRQQLGERLPGVFAIAAKAMGKSTEELTKLVGQGKITQEEFIIPFTNAMGIMAEKASGIDSAGKAVTRLKNAYDQLLITMGRAADEEVGVIGFVTKKATNFYKNWAKIFETNQQKIEESAALGYQATIESEIAKNEELEKVDLILYKSRVERSLKLKQQEIQLAEFKLALEKSVMDRAKENVSILNVGSISRYNEAKKVVAETSKELQYLKESEARIKGSIKGYEELIKGKEKSTTTTVELTDKEKKAIEDAAKKRKKALEDEYKRKVELLQLDKQITAEKIKQTVGADGQKIAMMELEFATNLKLLKLSEEYQKVKTKQGTFEVKEAKDKAKILPEILKTQNVEITQEYIDAGIRDRETRVKGEDEVQQGIYEAKLKAIERNKLIQQASIESEVLTDSQRSEKLILNEIAANKQIIAANDEAANNGVESALDANAKILADNAKLYKELKDLRKNDEDDRKKKDIERVQAASQVASAVLDGFMNLMQQQTQNELTALNKRYDAELRLAGDNEQKVMEINEKRKQEEKELRTKEFEAQRAAAIAQVVFKTAPIIAEYFVTGFLAPLAIAGLATAAAQIAFIAAQPVPEFKEGTKGKPFKGGKAIVGEIGKEWVVTTSGQVYETPGVATLVDLPKGSQVIPHHEVIKSERFMGSKLMNQGRGESGNGQLVERLISIENTLSKLPITSLTMDERGFTKKIQTKSRETRILNNRFGN
jgi:tape measure domain-containing protein